MERWCCVWRELVETKDLFEALLEVEGYYCSIFIFSGYFFSGPLNMILEGDFRGYV
jgi:hypothetical protein